MSESGTITALYRYPVKGLSPEALTVMRLAAVTGLAGDRAFALALGTTEFDAAAPKPLAKTQFLMLARNEVLAELSTRMADDTLTIKRSGERLLSADLHTPEGRAEAGAFFTRFAGEAAKGEIRVVSADGHKFTDVGAPVPAMMNCVSLINLASLRALEAAMGMTLDPLRFRANIYVDGPAAWSELEWVGRELSLAGQAFRVVRRTRRCPATNVNPATALRDADVPKALQAHFGHPDLGIYLEVLTATELRIGDAMTGPAMMGPA